MPMANNKTQCFTCNKEKITYSCKGCSKEFCFMDLAEHHKRLNEELHHIIDDYNAFKERINEQKQNPQNHALINQIDQWEIDSIEIIQQKAKECREIVIKLSQTCINDIEKKFNDLTEQIQQLQKENDFNEINFNYLTNQLIEITEELNNPSNISIQRESQSFMKEISIVLSKKSKFNKWKQNGITVAGGNGEGKELNQVNRPTGILIDKKKNIFIADSYNHRIVEWKYNSKKGKIVAGGNGEGHRINQLNYPTDVIIDQQNHSIIIADYNNRRVIQWLNQNQQILIDNIDCYGLAMDKNGFLYISDYQMDEVRRWKIGEYNNEGILVAGGNGEGQKLNHPTFMFVDEDQSIYVSDGNNNRVVKWKKGAKQGTVVAGGNGQGRNLNQLSYPRGVIVDHLGHIYVADSQNHRIMRCCEGKEEGEIVVGGNGKGNESNQLNNPYGLSFDNEGNLYVVDGWNHRIQKFDIVL
ncbi:unnamed protein product [Adineta steineri]|uniref:Uncharacterized protein n=1 Tax=Adineta steineri TaxID=433720 RepID=A0A816FH80_9BILA|nr:unnamed protein product [Adineta steineri]CAF1363092.1 unnamed protein product [Adineta steineri]CAF1368114.1 unnamed protein product [Adineta steineri]CAF1551967.1 unnamed protein product [Adineta steineri]CAF1661527.1 unnamed protein product [Adineta steineri]